MTVDYDGVILGGTVQGRVAAALAAREGARIALVEPPGAVDRQLRRQLLITGLAQGGDLSWGQLQGQIESLGAIAYPHLHLDYLASSGVDVVAETGQFSPRPQLAVTTATRRLRSRRYLLAPGTQVTAPDIPGLAATGYFTLDTLPQLDTLPESALVLGRSGGAIALAQALAQRGIRTTLVSRGDALLPTEDADISAFVAALLEAAGVTLCLGAQIDAIAQKDGCTVTLADGGVLTGAVLIVATAPEAEVEGLNLASLGIRPRRVYGRVTALPVDDRLGTAHPRVFACGPALGGYWADATDQGDVAIALRNALYLPWRQISWLNRPAQLHTNPEFTRLGLTATQARRWYGSEATLVQVPFGQVLKAHWGDDITGFCRWLVHRNGQLLGAQICGPGASELMQVVALAVHQQMPIQRIDRLSALPHSLATLLPLLVDEWQRQRWQPGTWRRDWAENWFNWRRSRPRP
jgi:pyruvate/2-oxoglutarate dehydrogenase complex dihydrolipoamide dehydrogenase (E3) component